MSFNVFALFFSPTGNTRKAVLSVAKGIADELAFGDYFTIDITSQGDRGGAYDFGPEDVVVIGMPTYAGRIPNKIMPYVEEAIYGDGAKVIPVVTYGNRAFDDSLKELATIVSENGMDPCAALSVPAEHAFSNKLAPLRPNEEDIEKLKEYGHAIAEKIKKGTKPFNIDALPGRSIEESEYYRPLKENGEAAKFLKAMVKTDTSKCTGCAECRQICPMGCFEKSLTEPEGICIKCHGCVHVCPQNAKFFDDEDLKSHIRMLENNYSDKENMIEVFGI